MTRLSNQELETQCQQRLVQYRDAIHHRDEQRAQNNLDKLTQLISPIVGIRAREYTDRLTYGDAFQAAMVAVLETLVTRYDPAKSRLTAHVAATADRALVDVLAASSLIPVPRTTARDRKAAGRQDAAIEFTDLDEVADVQSQVDPEQALLARERMQALTDLLDTLNPDERRVVTLLYGLGEHPEPLTPTEVAKLLGITVPAVTRVHRDALACLRARAHEHGLDDDER